MQNKSNCLSAPALLMEGALGERLKREYGIRTDGQAGMAHLMYAEESREALRSLWLAYAAIAGRHGLPILATTPTRRANRHSIAKSGLPMHTLQENLHFLQSVQEASQTDFLAGGMMGCAGNAYTGEGCLPYDEALALHRWAAEEFRLAGADFLLAALQPTLPEATAIAQAMAESGLPYLVSFTLQSNGKLIDDTPLWQAIVHIDESVSRKPVFYMTNCVHTSIVCEALFQPFNQTAAVRERFLGIQANTSPLPYSLLDASPILYTSPPDELAAGMRRLRQEFGFRLFGGCCGTDDRHLEAIASMLTRQLKEDC